MVKKSRPKVRPASVPAEAIWIEQENEWQLGDGPQQEGKPTGHCKAWRADGTLACEYELTADGTVTGMNTRYHPDGTLASRGEWRHGERFGAFVFVQSGTDTPELYPEDERTWRVEFDSTTNWSEENKRFFLQDGRECTATGRPLESAYDLDALFDRASPVDFIAGDSEAILHELVESEEAAEVKEKALDELGLDTIFGYQDKHVRPFLERLTRAKIFGFSKADSCESTSISHDRLPGYGAWGAEDGAVNLMEWYLQNSDGNYYERLGQAFSGAYSIGRLGDSDPWYVGLYDQDESKAPSPRVYLWSHEGHGFGEPDHASLDDFLYTLAANEAHAQTRLSDAGLTRTVERRTPAPENSDTRFFYWRAHWLIQMMDSNSQNNRLSQMRDEVFLTHLNTPIDDKLHQTRIDIGQHTPPTALYTLWRYFWFGHNSRLREAMDGLRKAPAKLTRDCVALMDELLDGRNQVASIDDVAALRSAFQALDLDPDRETQRNSELAVVAKAQQQVRDQLRESLPEVQKYGRAGLIERAWDVVDDWDSLQILVPVLRQFPGAAEVFDALHFVIAPADGKRADDDAIEAIGHWLGEHDTQPIQPLLWGATHDNCGASLALRQTLLKLTTRRRGSAHPRLLKLAFAELAKPTEYNHNRETAAIVLGQAAAPALPTLLALFDEYLQAMAVVKGDLRLSTIGWEKMLTAAAQAIYTIHHTHRSTPTDTTLARMHSITSTFDSHRMDSLTPICLRVQGLLGDVRACDAAIGCLNANNSDTQCEALIALAELARNNPQSHAKVRTARNPSSYSNLTAIAHAIMQHAAGVDNDINEAIGVCDETKSSYDSKGWLHYDKLVCEAIAHSQADVARLKPYLYAESAELREAAANAMRARKTTFDAPYVLTPFTVHGLMSQSDGAFLTALLHPQAVGLQYLLEPLSERAPEDRLPRLADALIEIIQRELQRLTPMAKDERISETLRLALLALRDGRNEHAAHEPRAIIAQCLQHSRPALVMAAIQCASTKFHTARIIQLLEATDHDCARQAAIWLTENSRVPNVSAMLAAAKITPAKLERFTK